MSKMRVYELAKELGKSSKELLEFLGEKNIEAKTSSSSIGEQEVALVKKIFGGKPEGIKDKKAAKEDVKVERAAKEGAKAEQEPGTERQREELVNRWLMEMGW